MENFVVSARKYRPATFDTVVGQNSITSTLKNAIRNNHLAQAFLFCGPRGVGKTTCARILAKTINCFKRDENIEACDKCESCLSFNRSHSLNVFELDAASNNSVEDIRKLNEQVRFAPQLGAYKVYIIDEVHMLSVNAFNAFLKTLEEPPAHAIFILATTEKHKIIPTILSRCQIFDFNRIQIDDIVNHLRKIATKESIQAEVDGLHIIAQKADGGLRDALSMFDQIVTFTGNDVTYKAVIENLNILDYDYYFKVIDAVLNQDIAKVLMLFNEILNHGFDGHNFLVGLGGHCRNLLVCKDPVTIQLLEVGANIKENYKKQALSCSQTLLLSALNLMSQADIQYKLSKNQRLLVELSLMQLCSLNGTNNMDAEKKNDIILIIPPKGNKDEKAISTFSNEKSIVSSAAHKPSPQPAVSKPAGLAQLGKAKTISIHQHTKNSEPLVAETGAKEDRFSIEAFSEFSLSDLNKGWQEYVEIIKKLDKPNFFNTLNSRRPRLNEDNVIVISLDNEVQKEEMKTEQTELLAFLKQRLKNSKISLLIHVNETHTEKKLFTAQEKYAHLVAKNPVLATLRQKLELGFEY